MPLFYRRQRLKDFRLTTRFSTHKEAGETGITAGVTAHLAQPIALSDLAAIAQMDSYHFLRAFRQTTGVTPHQDVLARRLARAHTLLKDLTLPITEVAARVGFQNPSHFAMVFRRRTGVTPTAYRTAQSRRPPTRIAVPFAVPDTSRRTTTVPAPAPIGGIGMSTQTP
jgi:AraC-like DNA-binding protein